MELIFGLLVIAIVAAWLLTKTGKPAADVKKKSQQSFAPIPDRFSVQSVIDRSEAIQAGREEFDAFMSARAAELRGKWLHASIAGVTHRNKDRTSRQPLIEELSPYEELVLEPEPENRFSRTAVAIYNLAGSQLGYVPEFLCRDVFLTIERGGTVEAFVGWVDL